MHDDYKKAFLTNYRIKKTKFQLWKSHIRLARTILIVLAYLIVIVGAIVLYLL